MSFSRIWSHYQVNSTVPWALLGGLVLTAGTPGCSDSSYSTQQVSAPSDEQVQAQDAANRVTDLAILDLRGSDITGLPGDISAMNRVRVLRLACNERMESLPIAISGLTELEELDIDNGNGCRMNLQIPTDFRFPGNLKRLNLAGALSDSSQLPIANLQHLESLDLTSYGSETIPAEVLVLKKLRNFRMEYSDLRNMSGDFSALANLEELHLCCNVIDAATWPDLKMMKALRLVGLGNNSLSRADQELIRSRVPDSTKVDFTNLWDGGGNEE